MQLKLATRSINHWQNRKVRIMRARTGVHIYDDLIYESHPNDRIRIELFKHNITI